MAKYIKLPSKTTINGIEYAEGTVLSVSESIFEKLGLPEYTVPQSATSSKKP